MNSDYIPLYKVLILIFVGILFLVTVKAMSRLKAPRMFRIYKRYGTRILKKGKLNDYLMTTPLDSPKDDGFKYDWKN